MQHVVNVGGGLASTMELPRRVVAQYGRENVTLLMARLPNEDPDVWRLCDAVSADLAVPMTYIGLDKTPWDVFFAERMMGSTMRDPCSRILKREVLDQYIRTHFAPDDTLIHVGITWDEVHRMVDVALAFDRKGYTAVADLSDDKTVTRGWLMRECERRYSFVPRLYKWGFSHNNCGGACVKAGLREWARLLYYLPDVYRWWERNEARFQRLIGTTATILRDRRKGAEFSLTLRNFRRRCERAWARSLFPGLPFDLLPGVRDMPSERACTFCAAVA